MTRVRFYHNAADPLALACELVGRAYGSGRRIAIRTADPASARRLDAMLWTFDARAFIPHVLADSPLGAETPVRIASVGHEPDWHDDEMLFNLAADEPAHPERFRMVVEIVGQSESDKLPARMRWQRYKAAGFDLQAFDAVRREAI